MDKWFVLVIICVVNGISIWFGYIYFDRQNQECIKNIDLVYGRVTCNHLVSCNKAIEMYNSGAYYLDGDIDGIPCENLCYK